MQWTSVQSELILRFSPRGFVWRLEIKAKEQVSPEHLQWILKKVRDGGKLRILNQIWLEIFIMIYLPTTGDLHHSRITDQQTHQSSDFLLPTHHREDIKQNLHIEDFRNLLTPPLNSLLVRTIVFMIFLLRLISVAEAWPGLLWSTNVHSCRIVMVKSCNDGVWYFSIKPLLTSLLVQPNRYFYFNLNGRM